MATTESNAPPHPSTREDRALELYRRHGHAITRIASNVYRVPSQDGARSYDVVYGAREDCPCPDHQHRRVACVHLLALGIMHASRRSGVKVRTISAAGDPFKAAGSRSLAALEERYHHELLDGEERQELCDRVLRLRRRMTSLKY